MRYDVVLVLDALDDPVAALASARDALLREGVVLVIGGANGGENGGENGERRLRETAAAAGFTRVRRLDGLLMELRR